MFICRSRLSTNGVYCKGQFVVWGAVVGCRASMWLSRGRRQSLLAVRCSAVWLGGALNSALLLLLK